MWSSIKSAWKKIKTKTATICYHLHINWKLFLGICHRIHFKGNHLRGWVQKVKLQGGNIFFFFLYEGKGKRFSNAHTSSISNEPKHHWGASERLKRWAEHYCTIYSIRSWSCTNLNTGVMTKWSQILDKRTSSVWPAYEFALADAHGLLPLKKVLGSLNLLFSLHFIQHLHPLYLHAHCDMYIYTRVGCWRE